MEHKEKGFVVRVNKRVQKVYGTPVAIKCCPKLKTFATPEQTTTVMAQYAIQVHALGYDLQMVDPTNQALYTLLTFKLPLMEVFCYQVYAVDLGVSNSVIPYS